MVRLKIRSYELYLYRTFLYAAQKVELQLIILKVIFYSCTLTRCFKTLACSDKMDKQVSNRKVWQ